ncbi:UbiA family prenyltransferase, partial [Myxococcota bacterium]|nr:UbiA family prenyltransferase [Myxococcota bacterium]
MIISFLHAILGTMRLRQWTKNIFVLAPLVFSHNLFSDRFAAALWMTLAFGLASSAVYFFNDLRDRPMDRLHPVKRLRPIAAGRLSPATAWITLTVFALAALGLAVFSGGSTGLA